MMSRNSMKNKIDGSSLRRQVTRSARRIVVKVGSNVLASDELGLDAGVMASLVAEVSRLWRDGREVVLVSSGAILAGRVLLGMKDRPRLLPEKQACAAVGQPELLGRYRELFGWHGCAVSQVLLTAEDLRDRRRYLNARNTLRALLGHKVVPIVNENDTVSVEEIKFGDNDILSALVSTLVEADLLLILSDVAGLYSSHPEEKGAELIDWVQKIGPAEHALVQGGAGEHGLGGMGSKLDAAARVMKMGIPMIVASGKSPGVLPSVLQGDPVGTLFHSPSVPRLQGRKHWLAFAAHPKGILTLDPGACRAIADQGKSLLPSGIQAMTGRFDPGDPVVCNDTGGNEIARGLVNFSAEELNRIKGCHTSDIIKILGYKDYDEVIHRNNLVLR